MGPQRDARTPPERGTECKRTGFSPAGVLGQESGILSAVLKARIAESFQKRKLSGMLAETLKGNPRSSVAGGPLWRVPQGGGRKLCLEVVSRTHDWKARESPSHRTVRPCYPFLQAALGTCGCPFYFPPPLPGRLTPAASSPLPGLGPGPEAAADLDGLSVVDFYHVEVKTVDSFARGNESAAF